MSTLTPESTLSIQLLDHQQQQHHLGACEKCTFSSPIPDGLNQDPTIRSSHPPRNADTLNLRTTEDDCLLSKNTFITEFFGIKLFSVASLLTWQWDKRSKKNFLGS